MSNLRRKILESHGEGLLNPNKTISRKAASRASSAASSRAGSRATSRATSRANSRQVSRHNSEDEYDTDDAATVFSQDTQLDEMSEFTVAEVTSSTWEQVLGQRIEEILDRKRSSSEGRELAYTTYSRFLLANYAQEEIEGRTLELADAFLRSIKAGRTEKEALLATRALALTIITDPSEALFDRTYRTLKAVVVDHESSAVKSLSISTLAIACFYLRHDADALSLMDFFMDIISSDGDSVGAYQSAEVVTAALQGWGLLCTSVSTDPQTLTEEAIDCLVDQLDSSHVEVQVAAGENIALLYEMSFTEADEEKDADQIDYYRARGKVLEYDDTIYVQRYQPYGREYELINTLSTLTTGAKKYLHKKDKKSQHTAFQTILQAVEHPLLTQGRPRQKLTLKRDSQATIDEWWKLVRVNGMKRMLRGGWQTHMMHNDRFFRMLGLSMDDAHSIYRSYRSKPKGKKARWTLKVGDESDEH